MASLATTDPLSLTIQAFPDMSIESSAGQLDNNHTALKIRPILQSFLHRCNIAYPGRIVYDSALDRATRAECTRLGIPLEGPYSAAPYIPASVYMAQCSYAHLVDQDTRLYTSVYSAMLIYTDDTFGRDARGVRDFHARFSKGETQADPTLEGFAKLLRELPVHLGEVAANLALTGTLNLVNALLLEEDTRDMTLHAGAAKYPWFARCMSGTSESYAVFTFSRDTPIRRYIQALPDMGVYINNTNDILSFYKEELAGERCNQVSLLAGVRGISWSEALSSIVDDTVAAHQRVQDILAAGGDQAALRDYLSFSAGYVAFHVAAERYKLAELHL